MANRRIETNVFIALTFFIIRSSSRCSYTFNGGDVVLNLFLHFLLKKNKYSMQPMDISTKRSTYWILNVFKCVRYTIRFSSILLIKTLLVAIYCRFHRIFCFFHHLSNESHNGIFGTWQILMSFAFESVNINNENICERCASLHLSNDQHQNWR